MNKFGPAGLRYIIVTVLFFITMTVKVFIDRPWESDNLFGYIASSIIVIPVVWYAGYFFREAQDHYRTTTPL